jgi:4-amino-4-deoxy-L-arabinose transferase-like glycosyltransferase
VTFFKTYRLEICIVLLAVLVRVVLLLLSLHATPGPITDTISGADCYFTISQNILAGNGYSCSVEPPYISNSIRPPVQPYFIAGWYAVSGTYWVPLVLQMLAASIIPLLGAYIARHITRNDRAAIVVGVLLALEPLAALFSFLFYPETLCTLFFLLGVLCVFEYLDTHRLRALVFAAVSLGSATLAKPTIEYVPLLVIAALAWHYRSLWRQEVLRIAIFAATFILVLTPWLMRNYHEFGVVSLSPQLGEQLYAVLVPSVLSMHNGTTFAEEFRVVLTQGAADPNQARVSDEKLYMERALPILRSHPRALTIVLANTALNFYIHDGVFEVLKRVGAKPTALLGKPALFVLLSEPGRLFSYMGTILLQPAIFILFARVFWMVVTVFFFTGMVRYIRNPNTKALLSVGLVLYFMTTTLVIGLAVTGRYRIPVESLILSVAVYGALPLVGKVRRYYGS